MKDILVSVIIPVYNVENYIVRCVNSVLNQTFKNLDIIIIDDKSTDSSFIISQQFSNHCRLFQNIENVGLSATRNNGLKNSKGDYVLFLDSDDYIHPRTVEFLVSLAIKNNADFGCFSFQSVSDDKNPIPINVGALSPHIIEGNENIVKDALLRNYIKTSSAMKIYKRSFLIDNDIAFVDGIINEDMVFTACISLLANKVFICEDKLYCYYQRSNSISRNYQERNITQFYDNYNIICDFYQRHSALNKYQEYLCQYVIVSILFVLVSICYSCNYSKYSSLYDLLNYDVYFNKRYGRTSKLKSIPIYVLYNLSRCKILFFFLVKVLKIMGIKRYN